MDDLEGDAELIEAFIVESRESLDAIDDALLDLESSPNDLELVREIFRRIHSVKGASGFLGLVKVESVSHSGEHLLSKVRDGEIAFGEEIASALLDTVDALRTVFDQLDTDGTEGTETFGPLLDRLARLREGEGSDAPLDPADAPLDPVGAPLEPHGATVDSAGADLPTIADPPHSPNPIGGKSPVGRVLVEGGLITEAQLTEALDFQRAGDHRRLGELVAAVGYTTITDVENLINTFLENFGAEIPDPETQQRSKGSADSSIRVDLEVLDGIVGLVGELVLARNQIVQATDSGATDIGRMASELAYITSSLQEQALRTRMQRIESAWRSLPRVVRDVGKATGKDAELVMSGEGIELDRTIIEAIRDPLVHLVRNAVDHGLESNEQRAAVGKPTQGTIRLSAIQDGGHVIIEVADDGAGIDPDRIAQSALDKRMITQSEVDAMTDAERVELILRPGFSTATEVTKISGRGVGMDVVASNLKEIRGTLEIRSEMGKGTAIRLAIPLTLAIVPALVVSNAGQTFAIPQASVVELVRLQGDDLHERIEWIHSAPILRLREQLLPLIELADVLQMPVPQDRSTLTVIVVQSGDQPFGLIVDSVTKAEEIVVKPVSRQVQQLGVYAGATVMGDGSAALILDITAIARQCNLAASSGGPTVAGNDEMSDKQSVLTVMVGERRIGLPTADLERLEKVAPEAVEWSGDQMVVQYRDRLLPVVYLSEFSDRAGRRASDQPLRVVVTSERAAMSVGLVVDSVLDVVAIDPQVADEIGTYGRTGAAGSIIHNGELIELLDIPRLIAHLFPNLDRLLTTEHHHTYQPDQLAGSAV